MGPILTLLPSFQILQGAQSDELAAASRLEDSINFYQTSSPDVAKLFHIDPEAKRPCVVLLKKEEEKLTFFGRLSSSLSCSRFRYQPSLPIFVQVLTVLIQCFHADGEFKASVIADFVSANKLPLVTTLTQETSPSIFGNSIKKQACYVDYNRIPFIHSNIFFNPCAIPLLRLCIILQIRFYYLLLQISPRNFCPSLRKQQSHSRER